VTGSAVIFTIGEIDSGQHIVPDEFEVEAARESILARPVSLQETSMNRCRVELERQRKDRFLLRINFHNAQCGCTGLANARGEHKMQHFLPSRKISARGRGMPRDHG
jgi:hypothetical protein